MQRVWVYVKEYKQAFVRTAAECGEQAAKKVLAQQKKELDKADKQLLELNGLFRKLYEDIALGRLPNEQSARLASGYEVEKAALMKRAAELQQEIDTAAEREADVKRFVALVRRYSEIRESTYENVH